jgi:catalase
MGLRDLPQRRACSETPSRIAHLVDACLIGNAYECHRGYSVSRDGTDGYDDYTQAGNLIRLMGHDAQQRLIANIVGSMKGIPERIQRLQISHFYKADPQYGLGVAAGLGLEVPEALATQAGD